MRWELQEHLRGGQHIADSLCCMLVAVNVEAHEQLGRFTRLYPLRPGYVETRSRHYAVHLDTWVAPQPFQIA
jgi:hypothetical protein